MEKDNCIKQLNIRLTMFNTIIAEYEKSIKTWAEIESAHAQHHIADIKKHLTNYKQQKVETENGIAWLNTL
jgi:hypothetical protein